MLVLATLLSLALQEEPYKTLVDPTLRSQGDLRKGAAEAFRLRAGTVPSAYVASRFLERSDHGWKLVAGLPGKITRDPVADPLDAYLKTYWTGAPVTPADHRKALELLESILAKAPPSDACDAVRLFMLLHASELGDQASDIISKLGFTKDGDRWGRKDDLLVHAMVKGLSKAAYVSSDSEKQARSVAAFGPRYAASLFDLYRVFAANQGYGKSHAWLINQAGLAPTPRAAEHLRALAASLRSVVYCRSCKDGKITCGTCKGGKRGDFPCPVCHTLGWAQKPGGNANTLTRCRRCAGAGMFKNAACPECKETGQISCGVCDGKPWRDGFKGCKEDMICGACNGKGKVETPCGDCGGKGRAGGGVAGIPTILCVPCKGNASIVNVCADCKETGLAPCKRCGPGVRDGKSRSKVEDVYTTTPCGACGGKGFPLPNLAVPCERCLGVTYIVVPTADPAKTLVE